MPKWMKLFLKIGAIAVAIGLVLTVIGWFVGTEKNYTMQLKDGKLIVKCGSEDKQELPYTKLDSFTKIDVDMNSADIRFVKGDDFAIEYIVFGDEPIYSVENDTLTVKREQENTIINWNLNFSFENNNQITIYYPEDMTFEDVNVYNGYGDITLSNNIISDRVTVDTKYGDIHIEQVNGELFVSSSYGDCVINGGYISDAKVELKNGSFNCRNTVFSGTTEFSNSYGDIDASGCDFENLVVTMKNGSLNVSSGSVSGNVNLSNSYGDTSLNLQGIPDEAAYGYEIHNSYGDIRLNGNNYESKKVIEDSNAENQIVVDSKNGDVNISIT